MKKPRSGAAGKPREVPSDVTDAAARVVQSDYYKEIEALRSATEGKTVAGSMAGTSGFVLLFTDGTWAASFLGERRLRASVGKGKPGAAIRASIGAGTSAKAARPRAAAADAPGDIATEVAKTHGRSITGFAVGFDSFNIGFPDDYELDTHLVKDGAGRTAMSVTWAQW